jgi:hypothetical protein
MRAFGDPLNANAYYYNATGGDFRTALKDDYSTTMPIASSDIIGVGGPLANRVAQYFNEFSPVIYRGEPWFKSGTMTDLLPVSDWGGAKGTATTLGPYNIPVDVKGPLGYAVVTVYKDINGTVGFMVWGLTANDTYWASQAMFNTGQKLWEAPALWKPGIDLFKRLRVDNETFGGNANNDLDTQDPLVDVPLAVVKFYLEKGLTMEQISLRLNSTWGIDGMNKVDQLMKGRSVPLIEFLQEENCGVTAVVLAIDYTYNKPPSKVDFHPKITIVEELGTKSEKPQHDP